MIAQAQDGADTNGGFPDLDHSNNANMLVLPDGQPGFMQMYLWDPIADLDPVTPPNYRAVHGATTRRSSSTSTRTASRTGWSPTPRATAR